MVKYIHYSGILLIGFPFVYFLSNSFLILSEENSLLDYVLIIVKNSSLGLRLTFDLQFQLCPPGGLALHDIVS